MIRNFIISSGEHFLRAGEILNSQANSYRIEYGNPREIPEQNGFDTLSIRFKNLGNTLISFANR